MAVKKNILEGILAICLVGLGVLIGYSVWARDKVENPRPSPPVFVQPTTGIINPTPGQSDPNGQQTITPRPVVIRQPAPTRLTAAEFKTKADKADQLLDQVEADEDKAESRDDEVLKTCEDWQQAVLTFYASRSQAKLAVGELNGQASSSADQLRLSRIKNRLRGFDWAFGIDDPPYHLGDCQGY